MQKYAYLYAGLNKAAKDKLTELAERAAELAIPTPKPEGWTDEDDIAVNGGAMPESYAVYGSDDLAQQAWNNRKELAIALDEGWKERERRRIEERNKVLADAKAELASRNAVDTRVYWEESAKPKDTLHDSTEAYDAGITARNATDDILGANTQHREEEMAGSAGATDRRAVGGGTKSSTGTTAEQQAKARNMLRHALGQDKWDDVLTERPLRQTPLNEKPAPAKQTWQDKLMGWLGQAGDYLKGHSTQAAAGTVAFGGLYTLLSMLPGAKRRRMANFLLSLLGGTAAVWGADKYLKNQNGVKA